MRRDWEGVIRSVDEKAKTIEWVLSTRFVDRDESIILPGGIQKRIDPYKTNPILCWGHPLSRRDAAPDPMDCLGKALEMQFTKDDVSGLYLYAYDINARAKFCFDMAVAGFLPAGSVGGLPHSWVCASDPESKKNALPDYAQQSLAAGDCWIVYDEMELLEFSQVFVGSNRQALKKALEAKLLTQRDLACLMNGQIPERKMVVPVAAEIKTQEATEAAKREMVIKDIREKVAADPLVREALARDYSYSDGYSSSSNNPRVADIQARLRSAANTFHKSVDPKGTGDVSDVSKVKDHVGIIKSVASDMCALYKCYKSAGTEDDEPDGDELDDMDLDMRSASAETDSFDTEMEALRAATGIH